MTPNHRRCRSSSAPSSLACAEDGTCSPDAPSCVAPCKNCTLDYTDRIRRVYGKRVIALLSHRHRFRKIYVIEFLESRGE